MRSVLRVRDRRQELFETLANLAWARSFLIQSLLSLEVIWLQGKIYLVTGGTRSGKSAFAEQLAANMSRPVTYIATAVITDAEMEERVKLHRKRRPPTWEIKEEPYAVASLINQIGAVNKVLLLDCLSVLVGNLQWKNWGQDNEQIQQKVRTEILDIIEATQKTGNTLIVVSSEVGLGIVPEDSYSRFYRDLLGEANQQMAKVAEEVYLVAAGIPLALKRLKKIWQQDERS